MSERHPRAADVERPKERRGGVIVGIRGHRGYHSLPRCVRLIVTSVAVQGWVCLLLLLLLLSATAAAAAAVPSAPFPRPVPSSGWRGGGVGGGGRGDRGGSGGSGGGGGLG